MVCWSTSADVPIANFFLLLSFEERFCSFERKTSRKRHKRRKRGREGKRETDLPSAGQERNRPSICSPDSFNSQIRTEESQQLGSPSWSPTWVSGAHKPLPSATWCCLPKPIRGKFNRKLSNQNSSRAQMWDAGISDGGEGKKQACV